MKTSEVILNKADHYRFYSWLRFW